MRLLVILVLLLLPSIAFARSGEFIRLSPEPTGDGACEIAEPGPGGFFKVYVVIKYSPGITGISFSAPIPPDAGLQFAYETPGASFYPVGSSQTHVDVGFGTCQSGSFMVMEMNFFRVSQGSACTPYRIQSGATQTDCGFQEWPIWAPDGVALNSNGSCNPVPIRNPSPADGAVNVPLTTALDWEDAYYLCNAPLAASGTGSVYFGTTSTPPYNAAASATHTVGPLAPGTKYYWKVSNEYPSWISPVWSFTTTNDVATRSSTWGAIKALYR